MKARAFGVFVFYASLVLLVGWAFLSTPQEVNSDRAPQPLVPLARASIIFGGDMMFDRTIRTLLVREGEDYIFSCIKDVLQGADLVLANLEGPITSHDSVSVGTAPGMEGNYTFTFPLSTAELLKRHNITLVNIGNNHIMNFGREGLLETKQALSRAGVRYFGDPDSAEADRVARLSLKGIPFSFVNWSDWTSDKTDHTVAQVEKEAMLGRIVVVYTHWGEEYAPVTPRVRQLAHSFVEAGADIVLGSHPHVVQEHEIYKGAHIYYSLGNLVFDQYWEESVRRGLLVRVEFTPTGIVKVDEIPIDSQNDRRPCAE